MRAGLTDAKCLQLEGEVRYVPTNVIARQRTNDCLTQRDVILGFKGSVNWMLAP